MAIWDSVPSLEETIAQIDRVTLQGVVDFGETTCVAAKPALALYGPVAAAPDHRELQARLAA